MTTLSSTTTFYNIETMEDFKTMKKSTVAYLFIALSLLVLSTFETLGGELTDEFNSPKLNEELWVIKKVRDASYKIKEGKLILSSPKVSDGIILYYKEEVSKPGFSFEAKLDSSGIANSGYVTTMKTMTPPEASNVYNPLRLGQFRLKPTAWRVRDENIQTVLDGNVTPGMHAYKIELDKNTLKFYFDGKQVAEIPRVVEKRFFSVSPDPYADDYSGELVIEYIKIAAPWIQASVSTSGKLASIWGGIKSCQRISITD